jgi:hypothetical protein
MKDIEEDEVLSPEIVKHFENDAVGLNHTANHVADYLWEGADIGEGFHDAVLNAAQELEKNFVSNYPDKDLPLLAMDSLKWDESKQLLERRLKGENPNSIKVS